MRQTNLFRLCRLVAPARACHGRCAPTGRRAGEGGTQYWQDVIGRVVDVRCDALCVRCLSFSPEWAASPSPRRGLLSRLKPLRRSALLFGRGEPQGAAALAAHSELRLFALSSPLSLSALQCAACLEAGLLLLGVLPGLRQPETHEALKCTSEPSLVFCCMTGKMPEGKILVRKIRWRRYMWQWPSPTP